jgi:hypothetical protein
MKKLNEIINKYYRPVLLVLTLLIFFNTCGNPNRSVNKRLDALTKQVDSLESVTATKKDLEIEGLRVEKRMIQSTDRKILDVQRQAEIDKLLKQIESK